MKNPNNHEGNVLEVSDLGVSLRGSGLDLVTHVSFGIGKGETLALVGESGSGKSLTSLAILRLLPKSLRVTGRIVLKTDKSGHIDLMEMGDKQVRKVRGKRLAMIFQEPMTSLNPVFTIGDQIEESLRVHLRLSGAAASSRAEELLRLVGIPDPKSRLSSYPHELSGGMRQRVMIAIALSCDPDVLIADEPTTALDVTIQAQILELIHSLQQKLGMAVLFITHDLGVVAEIADRVMVMYAGRIVEEAPVAELFARPAHPYTRALLKSAPQIHPKGAKPAPIVPIPGIVPDLANRPLGCAFHTRCQHAVVGVCETQEPQRVVQGENHIVRCLRAGELDAEAKDAQ